jgi:hypothetical protein
MAEIVRGTFWNMGGTPLRSLGATRFASDWPVVGLTSVIDFASSLLGRVEVRSLDFDHN